MISGVATSGERIPKHKPGFGLTIPLGMPTVLLVSPWMLGAALQYLWPIRLRPEWPIRIVGIILVAGTGFWELAKFLRRRRAASDPARGKAWVALRRAAPQVMTGSPRPGPLAVYLGFALLVNWFWPLLTLVPFGLLFHWGIAGCDEPRRKQ